MRFCLTSFFSFFNYFYFILLFVTGASLRCSLTDKVNFLSHYGFCSFNFGQTQMASNAGRSLLSLNPLKFLLSNTALNNTFE